MKPVSFIIVLVGFLLVLCSCDPPTINTACSYRYPINIRNLKDTIKTTDTLWVENDFAPRFCLQEGVYKNGIATEHPIFQKLSIDTLLFYAPIVINYTRKAEGIDSAVYYAIEIREQSGRYKSKYGIVFPEQGIYLLYNFGGLLENRKDASIFLDGYFNTQVNNTYLLPPKLREYYDRYGSSYNYHTYFIKVIE